MVKLAALITCVAYIATRHHWLHIVLIALFAVMLVQFVTAHTDDEPLGIPAAKLVRR